MATACSTFFTLQVGFLITMNNQNNCVQNFKEAFAQLQTLETFSWKTFEDSHKNIQSVCNFVLSLALIYNDSKNLTLMLSVLGSSKPAGGFKVREDWGEYNGINMHIIRMLTSLLNELMKLIKDNENILKESLFKELVESMGKDKKEAWEALINAAMSRGKKRDILVWIRDKMCFHYDIKAIFQGFKEFFLQHGNIPPLVSRGNNMLGTRFYFADAAANGYFYEKLDIDFQDFDEKLNDYLGKLNFALFDIVTKFVNKRCYGWQKYTN